MPYQMEPVVGPAWQPTHYTDGRPHAGLLSTSAFYEVWDTNNTNVNRRRANRWSIAFHCYNFLDTPVDVTRDVDNNDAGAVLSAVTTRADCKACHDRLDPMASFLFPHRQRVRARGRRRPGLQRRLLLGRTPSAGARRTSGRRPSTACPARTSATSGGSWWRTSRSSRECQTQRAFQLLFLRETRRRAASSPSPPRSRPSWVTEDGYNFRALVRRWMLSDAYTRRPEDDGSRLGAPHVARAARDGARRT